MVNYAEAMCELGKFDQTAADKSINKLRARGHVAKMTVEDITDDFDTTRDPSVPALLWEVRRERRVELMGKDSVWMTFADGKKETMSINARWEYM